MNYKKGWIKTFPKSNLTDKLINEIIKNKQMNGETLLSIKSKKWEELIQNKVLREFFLSKLKERIKNGILVYYYIYIC